MQKLTKEKGITLIALIITIIVMLILVGVTVSVALNGGLFKTTKEASLETRAAIVDEMATEWKAVKEMDRYGGTTEAQTLESLLNDLENQKLLTAEEKEEVLSTGRVTIGNRTIVFEEIGQDSDMDLLIKYFLGEYKEGKYIETLIVENSDPIMFENDESSIIDARTSITFINTGENELDPNEVYIDIGYNRKKYRVTCVLDKEVGMAKSTKVELIFELPEGADDKDLLTAYFSNNDIIAIINEPDGIFTDDPYTIGNASESIVYTNQTSRAMTLLPLMYGNKECNLYISYNNKPYKVSFEANGDLTNLKFKKIELGYEQQGREGEIVKFDGDNDGIKEDWMILYDNHDNVEIISMDVMGSLKLGHDDEKAIGSTDMDRAIYSYNNAVERMTDYCKELIKNPSVISVRSAGSNPSNPYSENTNTFEAEDLKNYEGGKYNGIAKCPDLNYEEDFIRMTQYDIAFIGKEYWIPERLISGMFGRSFCIMYIDSEGNFNNSNLFKAKDGTGWGDGFSSSSAEHAVRPIVKINSSDV